VIDLGAIRRAVDPDAPAHGNVRCPVHDDRRPSLSLALGEDDRLLVHCKSGCEQRAVFDAVRQRAGHLLNGAARMGSGRAAETAYTYKDPSGKPLARVLRKDAADGSKDFRQQTPDGNGGWQWKGPQGATPLYGLDRLARDANATAVLCEGEKAAEAAQRQLGGGFVCLSWMGGAGAVARADLEPLRGRDVVIWPDNDPAGIAAAGNLCTRLRGLAGAVKIVRVSDLPPKADAADVAWTADELLARLEEPQVTEPATHDIADHADADRKAALPLADRVKHLPNDWALRQPPARPFVMHPYVPRRAVSALLGAGTAGKTLVLSEWAAAIATDSDWRGHAVSGGDVCVVTWEDERDDYHAKLYSLLQSRPDMQPLADTIRKRVHFIELHGSMYRLVAGDERGRPTPTALAGQLVDLIKRDFPETVQVFIETVSRANAADETNEAMAMVVSAGEVIAHALDCGVTVVHHISKAAATAGIVDATAGRGGSALADNCRASTVIAPVTGDSPQSLWPEGFASADFIEREIVLIENARSSYGRKAERMHLERIYPPSGAPHLRAVAAPVADNGLRRDTDAEKLASWLLENLDGKGATEDAIARRRSEYGLSERAARSALARLAKSGAVVAKDERQYGEKGRMVTRFRMAPSQERLTNAA
jgi:hypothetical protein